MLEHTLIRLGFDPTPTTIEKKLGHYRLQLHTRIIQYLYTSKQQDFQNFQTPL